MTRTTLLGALALGVVACTTKENPPAQDTAHRDTSAAQAAPAPQQVGETSDLKTPESVKYDADLDVFFISDVDGNPVYLAPNRFNLQVAMERWPQVRFHATREDGQRMEHA